MTLKPTLRESVAVLVERVGNLIDSNNKAHAGLTTQMVELTKHCNHEIELLTEEVNKVKQKFIIQDAINLAQKTKNEDCSNKLYRKLRDFSLVAGIAVSVTTIILKFPWQLLLH